MVSYGPWTQDPDFDITTRRQEVEGAYNARRAPMMIANSLPFTSIQQSAQLVTIGTNWVSMGDGGDVFSAARGVSEAWDLTPFLPSPVASRIERGHELGTAGASDWTSSSRATIERYPWYVPIGYTSASGLGWSPFAYIPEEWPVGAVGIEFEGGDDAPERLGVRLLGSTLMRAENVDRSGVDEVDHTLSDIPPTNLFVQTVNVTASPEGRVQIATYHDLRATGPDETILPLGEDIDLTWALGERGLVLSTLTETFVGPKQPDGPSFSSNFWQFGWHIHQLDIGWTLRPPRYRWIYDTVPIRRTFPRDDGLAGGAGRTWPPPSSQQSSNRTFGGYL